MDDLPIMETFYTIQGEGHYSGAAAYFIRLGGCDIGCNWCDVKDSWDVSKHPTKPALTLANEAKDSGCKIVVVTGGEPFMHDLTKLTKDLKSYGLRTHVETSGVYSITGYWDWICFSPKKYKKPLKEYYKRCDEIKIIVYHRSDLRWALEHEQFLQDESLCYLQPEWSKESEMLPIIIQFVKNNPRWKISLQSHKYMNIP